ncbi:enolase C-terminal domain-like protein [Kineococcus sp. SYSU DK004]|uniref:enolase C-terminal domain-like protein n=1 Tax=Kineococcus sp. SYSU DK004 TaxID=3383125 RepID=UPI003D7DE7E8
MPVITAVRTRDVRFPTSLELDGSDAVNVDPDYSAAHVEVDTDDGAVGTGIVFTCGRGNEVVVAALESYGHLLTGSEVDLDDLGEASRRLVHDSQLRWLGPEKGVSHMACGGLVNALWDLRSRRDGQPLWRVLSSAAPDELVDVVDFTHISDALSPAAARDLLVAGAEGKEQRVQQLEREGYPAYTTTPGWLGYDDDKLVRLAREAVADGFGMIKLKVGGDLDDDRRRMRLAREAVGPGVRIAVDANQRWEVGEAVEWMRALAEHEPWWIEEPTSTDDVLGHATIRRGVAPVKVATGEAVANRIVVKQLLQAGAIDVLQIDATRVAGVNENVANLLLAARFGVPVCPHAGGVGLCELVQHFSFFDYAAVTGTQEDRAIEYVDHLHEHFTDPVVVRGGRYAAPTGPGTGARMHAESVERWTFPGGEGWRELLAGGADGAGRVPATAASRSDA